MCERVLSSKQEATIGNGYEEMQAFSQIMPRGKKDLRESTSC